MKTYKAVFNRYNPQLGSYETERTFEAENKREAKKHCKKIEEQGCQNVKINAYRTILVEV